MFRKAFEKDNRIVYKNLKDGSEKVIDDGRYPCVSPDGEYVSYVKASPQGIENVWIADLDFATKRQVTVNFSKKSLHESNPVDKVEQTVLYSYYEPVWSSDSSSLYVIKNQRDIDFSRLMRIDFTAEKLTAEDTVKRFTQALIVRDEDYARSLMKTPPPGYLTVSNPHYVGYEILKAGNEKNKTYVDAEMHLQYTANPYYQIVKCRFYLSSDKNGYIIDSIEKQGSIEVMELENDKTVKMNAVGKETVLFKESDIPAEYLPSSPYRIASLVYNEPTKTVYFSLQLIKDENNHSAVKLLSYSLPEKKFRLLDQINYIAGNRDVVISQMAADSAGEFLTVDLFSESDPSFTSHTLVYNLKNNQKTNLSDLFSDAAVGSTFSSFWDGSDLYFNINGQGQTMKYIYNAQNSILNSF